MIRVLIADDEAYFRTYMEHVIDWEKEGMTICASCKSASEIMEYFNHNTADIILIDINMPGMNGLMAAEELKRKKPELYIIFVTGYSEFEYAKKALKLGAEDYLLKPFSKVELTGCLQKVISKMKMKRMEKQRHRLNEKIATEELLRRWIHSANDDEEQSQRKHLLKRDIFGERDYFYVVVLEADAMEVMRKRQEDIALWNFIVENITGEICEAIDPKRILFRDLNDRLVVILNTEHKMEKSFLLQKFEAVQEAVRSITKYTVSVGISQCVTEKEEITGAYREAVRVLGEKFVVGNEYILFAEDVSFQGNTSKRSREIIRQVENYIAENYQDAELTVEKIAEGIFLDSSYVRRIVSRQLGCTVNSFLSAYRMKKAKELLKETNMSVSEVAEKVGYGEPGYFSRCFRKYYGVTPREFASQSKK